MMEWIVKFINENKDGWKERIGSSLIWLKLEVFFSHIFWPWLGQFCEKTLWSIKTALQLWGRLDRIFVVFVYTRLDQCCLKTTCSYPFERQCQRVLRSHTRAAALLHDRDMFSLLVCLPMPRTLMMSYISWLGASLLLGTTIYRNCWTIRRC